MRSEADDYKHADRNHYKYCARYCEENVWHLCQEPEFERLEMNVVLISNEQKACAFWHQRSALRIGIPQVWDYHVILVVRAKTWLVWDLDSTLGLPIRAKTYFDKTLQQLSQRNADYAPLFRIFGAVDYVEGFRSDRSHMRDNKGKWLAPPPPWPLILGGGAPTLLKLIDFRPGVQPECITLDRMYCIMLGQESRGSSQTKISPS
jgi:protein N-terminal glutamine amidohydrolase